MFSEGGEYFKGSWEPMMANDGLSLSLRPNHQPLKLDLIYRIFSEFTSLTQSNSIAVYRLTFDPAVFDLSFAQEFLNP